jgi:hypothetical protein
MGNQQTSNRLGQAFNQMLEEERIRKQLLEKERRRETNHNQNVTECPYNLGYSTAHVCKAINGTQICMPSCQKMAKEWKDVVICPDNYVKHKVESTVNNVTFPPFEICEPLTHSVLNTYSVSNTNSVSKIPTTIDMGQSIYTSKSGKKIMNTPITLGGSQENFENIENFDITNVRNTCNNACSKINLVNILILVLIIILLYLALKKNNIKN